MWSARCSTIASCWPSTASRADFIAALRSAERGRHDPLGRAPLLHIEMILFAARAEKRRPELAKRLKARRDMVAEILTEQKFGDPAWISSLLLALEDGFRLHRLVDPASTPADSFFRAAARVAEAQSRIGRGNLADGQIAGKKGRRSFARRCSIATVGLQTLPATLVVTRGG